MVRFVRFGYPVRAGVTPCAALMGPAPGTVRRLDGRGTGRAGSTDVAPLPACAAASATSPRPAASALAADFVRLIADTNNTRFTH